MSVTIDLSTELESDLAAEAARLGLPLPEYILRLLASGRASGPAPRTGAELLAYWQSESLISLIGTRSDIADSPSIAEPYTR